MSRQLADIDKVDEATHRTWEAELSEQYEKVKASGLNLDLTRGKPSSDQLDLSNAMDGILAGDYTSPSGVDVRNYGGLEGILEARHIGAEMLEAPVENVIAGGNSSLELMHRTVGLAYEFGLEPGQPPWSQEDTITFICPTPGYDRHFAVCQHFGIQMVTVDMDENGPDMDAVETLIREDKTIRGMWCVPKYSNPTGVTYSDEVVSRIARLGKIAHPHFRVFWDNAYAIHDLVDAPKKLANIFSSCQQKGTENSVIQFASTSKVTLAGAGISFLAASADNLKAYKAALALMTIGPDKVNQLRHAKFFAAENALNSHMQKHAALIAPRFKIVLDQLEANFANTDLGQWQKPQGGYFISFDTRPGLAKTVVSLAGEAGVKLTPAGATFPYGKDPRDSNIRIAPTVPSVAELDKAMEVFVLCVELASVRAKLEGKA